MKNNMNMDIGILSKELNEKNNFNDTFFINLFINKIQRYQYYG